MTKIASTISYEYLQAIMSQANGLATLNGSGQLVESQLPISVVNKYKGEFADSEALTAAHPTALRMDHAYVEATTSMWYWNPELTEPAWTNQKISVAAYTALTEAQKTAVPYIIVP